MLSRQEEATNAFYEWERYLRGYYVFEYPVQLEPPYIQGSYLPIPKPRKKLDDGRVPSVFQRIKKAFEKEEVYEELEYDREPEAANYKQELRCLQFKLNYSEDVHYKSANEFLSLLSQSQASFSFEIIAQGKEIRVQIVCADSDFDRLRSLVEMYFDYIQVSEIEPDFDFVLEEDSAAILDFGLEEEVMRPQAECQNLDLDPLTAFFSVFKTLQENEVCMLQVLFKGVEHAWSREILNATSDGQGGSFFANAPEMPRLAQEKISSPLFGVVVRLAVQGSDIGRTEEIARNGIYAIQSMSQSDSNGLIPLSNEGYEFFNHKVGLEHRVSQRLGMLLNTNELLSFVHFPQPQLLKGQHISNRLTKEVPEICTDKKYVIGSNIHEGEEVVVSLDDESRLRHSHLIGATGTGKSTFIVKQFLEDIRVGNGCMLIDPHGDVVEDILARIPKERLNDVVVIDPSDMDFPIGFNLLEAKTEQEKLLLSSDLIDLFKRQATSWGDVMTAVLSNTINAFVESTKGGTLFELKKFLSDEKFRNEFLKTVEDPITRYYFENDFDSLKRNSLSPLLTRLDNFLRPRVLRNMFIQKEGINFHTLIAEKKIVLVKLSLGLIGQRNASFLGSLLITKLNQAAFARQSISKEDRRPFYLYLDEFQNVITDSLDALLSGARKYGLGLILAHQSLSQIKNKSEYVMQSVLNNAHIRICFRTSEQDAPLLAKGFSSIEAEDIMSQSIGQAYMRVGSSSNDFSLETSYFEDVSNSVKETNTEFVVSNSRRLYGANIEHIEGLIQELYPIVPKQAKSEEKEDIPEKIPSESTGNIQNTITVSEDADSKKSIQSEKESTSESTLTEKQTIEEIPDHIKEIDEQKEEYLRQVEEQEKVRKHRSLQNFTQTMAVQRGFKASIEEETKTGGRVDVGLVKDELRIAIEISVTNTADYEVQNIQKCFDDGYTLVYVISESEKHLKSIQKKAKEELQKIVFDKTFFFKPNELGTYLSATEPADEKPQERVNGWRVKVNYHPDDSSNEEDNSLRRKVLKAIKKK